MVWSYSGDPSDSNKDYVRFLVGDTDANDEQLQDAEIEFLLTRYNSNAFMAAADAARSIGAKYARRVDKAVGDLKLAYSGLYKHYQALAKDLQRQASLNSVNITAGGVFKATGEASRADDTILQPPFLDDQFDNPNTSRPEEIG